MNRTQVSKELVMRNLNEHKQYVSASTVIQSVSLMMMDLYSKSIGKNTIQQAISALKKEGMIDFLPSNNPAKPHTLRVSELGKTYLTKKSESKPLPKAKTVQPKQTEDKPMSTENKVILTYIVKNKEDGEVIHSSHDYSEAQEAASEYVIATQNRATIESMSTVLMAEYEPVITARYNVA